MGINAGGRVMSEDIYDVVIIGGGPAGLSAAQYAARAKLKTFVLKLKKPVPQQNLSWNRKIAKHIDRLTTIPYKNLRIINGLMK